VLLDIHGFAIRESAQVAAHTAGTANVSASVNNAGYAKGSVTLTLASAGTGTFVSGDVLTFARDTNRKYVVGTGNADISQGGTIVINGSGLRQAMTAASAVIATTAAYTANIALSRNAILFASRLPRCRRRATWRRTASS
jgi:hypothetical protein